MLSLRNKQVNVHRVKLLEILKANLSKHRSEYQEAMVDYQTKLALEVARVSKQLETPLTAEELIQVKIDFTPPANHCGDYEEIIESLEMSVDDTITLDVDSFKAYVKDEWYWKSAFATSYVANKAYIAGAV